MKAKNVYGVVIDSGPDSCGHGWYIGLRIENNGLPHSWFDPVEARKIARAILLAAKKPRKKTK